MNTYKELRELSLNFRRLSSNFLNSRDSDANILIQRFKKYIDETPFISELITQTISGVDYDYHECFRARAHGGWSEVVPPVDEKCHIKAMYDYMSAIIESNNVRGAAMSYFVPSGTKFDEMIRNFLDKAFKPLIDYINDAISKELILLEEDKVPTFTQHIEKVYGTVNQQGQGTINSTTFVYPEQAEPILSLLERIIPSVDQIEGVSQSDLEDVKDDLLSVEEQVSSQAPKKSRLQKALAGIKGFLGQVSTKTAVTLAVNGITNIDWDCLVSRIEEYIAML